MANDTPTFPSPAREGGLGWGPHLARRRGARIRHRPVGRPSRRDEACGLSAAGDGVDVADAFGKAGFAPAAAAVLRSEHLAEAGDPVDLVRVARMHGDTHHRRLGLYAVVEALP